MKITTIIDPEWVCSCEHKATLALPEILLEPSDEEEGRYLWYSVTRGGFFGMRLFPCVLDPEEVNGGTRVGKIRYIYNAKAFIVQKNNNLQWDFYSLN